MSALDKAAGFPPEEPITSETQLFSLMPRVAEGDLGSLAGVETRLGILKPLSDCTDGKGEQVSWERKRGRQREGKRERDMEGRRREAEKEGGWREERGEKGKEREKRERE